MTIRQEDETIDELLNGRLKVIQKKKGYRFSLDALLLAHFVRLRRQDSLLDMGTGSGVIALVTAIRHPDAGIQGIDIQEEMVDMATRSAALNSMENQVTFRRGDVCAIRRNFESGTFDAVVFNPPYRKLNSGRINPLDEKAMARHEIKGKLQDFLDAAAFVLKGGGRIFVIYPARRMVSLISGMHKALLEPKRTRIIHSHCDSEGIFILVEGCKGGGEELEILPPLFIYTKEGSYTGAMKEIFSDLCRIPSSDGA